MASMSEIHGFWGQPDGMCGARGRDREGVIRRSRPRLLKLSILGLKIFAQDLDLKSSTRRHLRWGGGSLRAFRRAMIDERVAKGTTTTWKCQTFNLLVFVALLFPTFPNRRKIQAALPKPSRNFFQTPPGQVCVSILQHTLEKHPEILPKSPEIQPRK